MPHSHVDWIKPITVETNLRGYAAYEVNILKGDSLPDSRIDFIEKHNYYRPQIKAYTNNKCATQLK